MPPDAKLKDGHTDEPQDDKEGEDRQNPAFDLGDSEKHGEEGNKSVMGRERRGAEPAADPGRQRGRLWFPGTVAVVLP
jgi:hypothetical protein